MYPVVILEEITSSIDSIKLIDENVVVTLSSRIMGKMLEQNFEGKFRYIRVWKIFGNQLKVIAGSCVTIQSQQLTERFCATANIVKRLSTNKKNT